MYSKNGFISGDGAGGRGGGWREKSLNFHYPISCPSIWDQQGEGGNGEKKLFICIIQTNPFQGH